MRQITKKAIGAFNRCERFRESNTTVTHNASGITILSLFGNEIARKNWHGDGKTEITNADFPSNTTKERLNGISGVSIQQKKGVWFLNGKEWDGKWTTV
jgi:hypothetical protein